MHFRVRGNNVQVVRTIVDRKTLKSKSVPVGSANVRTGVLSEQLLAALNENDVRDVRRWIERRQKINALRRDVELRFLDQRIYEAIAALKEAEPQLAAEVVPDALRAMTAFRRAAVKLGLAKQAREGGADAT